MTVFPLTVLYKIDPEIITNLLDQLQHIERLHLIDIITRLNLDNLVNLKILSLEGFLNDDFNFKLFKSLSNQLEIIKIFLLKFTKMFDGHNFSNLIRKCNINNHFPMLRHIAI